MKPNDDMHETRDEAYRKLLDSVAEPLPISRNLIEDTLRSARRQQRSTQIRAVVLRAAMVVLSLSLVAAVAWQWGRANSDATLPFGRAIQVVGEVDDYPFESVQAALGKIFRDVDGVLKTLRRRGDLEDENVTPVLVAPVLRAIDSAEPVAARYDGGFEALQAKVQQDVALSRSETAELAEAMRAGIYAIRVLMRRDANHAQYANIARKMLREQLTGTAEETDDWR